MATKSSKEGYLEKLEYLNLDLDKIPKILKEYEPLEFRISKSYNEIQYKQYKYIAIKEIQILLSPTNRMDDLEKKYKNSSNIADYLDSKNEKNIIKYTTFLNMLKNINIKEIQKIEDEQNKLNRKIPFKVKFEGNYLWQIYYSQNTDKYFMIVSTKDTDYSTFFYLLKKQLEGKRKEKIFVPVRNIEYSNKYLKKSEYEDIGNYLWLFTKDWALIYDVFDKSENMSIQIIGETKVYEKIKSPYKIELSNKEEAVKFYKLLKAMFILQTELPHYYKFKTSIDEKGSIEFYHEDTQIKYEETTKFVNNQFQESIEKKKEVDEIIKKHKQILEESKIKQISLEIEYLSKEKQISTFLECKRSFLGKVKYYFKYSKKKRRIQNEKLDIKESIEKSKNKESIKEEQLNKKINYTIEELVESYKDYEIRESEMKNILMDVNALKLRSKNTKKKIENATLFIEEIENHKRSIFEFWKYSNKDEVATLAEGEEEEINIIRKVTKKFDYEEDIESFGEKLDKIQRKVLSRDETDSIYITTSEIEILNKVKNNKILPKDIEQNLKRIKKEAKEAKSLTSSEDFDIFGGMIDDSTKIKKIANKNHRELPKDKFKILDINKNSKQIGYKLTLERIIENIKGALEKVELQEDISMYKCITDGKIVEEDINLFNLNPESEIRNINQKEANKINLYKINLKKGTKVVGYTNSIYYDNQNKTLPIGMNLDTKILVDISRIYLKQINKQVFKIGEFEDERDDFTNINVKTITVFEFDEQKEEK